MALLKSVDSLVTLFFSFLRDRIYESTSPKFRFIDALLCPKDIYWWVRHTAVANHLRQRGHQSVLDVGGGGRGISPFLNPKGSFVCILDKDLPLSLSSRKFGITFVKGDTCHLPFRSKCFDVACSIAVLPQIPRELRPQFLSELKRVGKRVVIFSEAVQDNEGLYRGLEWEIRFHHDVYKREHVESYSDEKINRRRVELDEISSFFTQVHGVQNYETTYKYISLAYRPIIGFLAGLMYYFRYKKRDDRPPYKSIVGVLDEQPEVEFSEKEYTK